MWRKRSTCALLAECKLVRPGWETAPFPQEIKNRTHDAEITLGSIFLKEANLF